MKKKPSILVVHSRERFGKSAKLGVLFLLGAGLAFETGMFGFFT
jgi:hypothetical protein